MPHAQTPFGSMTYVVRTSRLAPASLQALKAQIWTVEPLQTIYDTAYLDELVAGSLAERRFSLVLLVAFAALAVMLAAVGLYGVVSFSMVQRTHEIGVRMALGARAADVVRLIITQGASLAALGLGIGLTGAFATTRLLRGLLFEVTPTDPLTLVVVSGLLLAVTLTACYLPARRATRLDPVLALRAE